MTHTEIITDLKSRGEKNIRFREDGLIASTHGKHTHNLWNVVNGELVCIGCKTVY